MTIEIRVTDPYNTPRAQLVAIAAFLTNIAGEPGAGRSIESELHIAIAKDDNPETGSPMASEVFAGGGTTAPDPASVFGGNAAGVQHAPSIAGAVASSIAPVATAGISTVTSDSATHAATTANAAGTVAVPPPPANLAPVADLDKNGLPWDSRIHAGSKEKNKDGSWRYKRNLDETVKIAIENELRGILGNAPAAGSPAAPAPTSTVVEVPAASAAPNVGNVPLVPPSAAIPTPPASLPPVPPAPSAVIGSASSVAQVVPPVPAASPTTTEQVVAPVAEWTFPLFCARVTNAISNKQLTQEQLAAVLQQFGMSALPSLAPFPHLLPQVATALGFA